MHIQKPKIDNQITATEVRVIDADGTNIGVLPTAEAIARAKSQDLSLIEVAAKAKPPVARIMDFGKYQYQKEKEARAARKKVKEVGIRGVRARLAISPNDLRMKVKKADEFLAKGDHIRFEFILRGREKALKRDFVMGRLQLMLDTISTPHTVVDGPKRGPRGYIVTIAPEQHVKNKQVSTKTPEGHQDGKGAATSKETKPL